MFSVRKITLCGSTRFKKAFGEWNARLTLEGYVVYSVAMWSHGGRIDPTPEQKELLDQVHLKKILNSEGIFVLDVGGYIGESTRREINYATAIGREVKYLSKEFPTWTEDDCRYFRSEEQLAKLVGLDCLHVGENLQFLWPNTPDEVVTRSLDNTEGPDRTKKLETIVDLVVQRNRKK